MRRWFWRRRALARVIAAYIATMRANRALRHGTALDEDRAWDPDFPGCRW